MVWSIASVREPVDLLTELLACVDWRGSFTEPDGKPITIEDIARLIAYYKQNSPMSA